MWTDENLVSAIIALSSHGHIEGSSPSGGMITEPKLGFQYSPSSSCPSGHGSGLTPAWLVVVCVGRVGMASPQQLYSNNSIRSIIVW